MKNQEMDLRARWRWRLGKRISPFGDCEVREIRVREGK